MANALAQSHSPYLLQHAENPVEWHEWSDATFALAARLDKPIFLSVGYSTCHWCHVMAHESFEDDDIAELMNDTFINIKVDREERPDIDTVYMDVCQTMTGHGGWPLTILMTPEKKPFFAATYIPPEDRGSRIGMERLCGHVKNSWQNEREKLLKAADEITQYVQGQTLAPQSGGLAESIFKTAAEQFKQQFDSQNGGFGGRPKFPSPQNMLFLLRYSAIAGDETALFAATKTLDAMRLGGLWDHLGFGFHRYSTDEAWLLPHFEKMLYDNALLLFVYTEAYERTKSPRYKQTALEIVEYLRGRMHSPKGALFSAEDADSEGVEGKFYVWEVAEIRAALAAEDAEFFLKRFNFSPDGNYAEEHNGQKNGTNVPHLSSFLSPSELGQFERIRAKLAALRTKRVHPSLDDKVLTDWNGLAIAALAKAARVFSDSSILEMTTECMSFLDTYLTDENGFLRKRYRAGAAGLPAHLLDYASVIWANTELFISTQNSAYLSRAKALCEVVNSDFWDSESGGYFLTAESGEALITRPKELYDGAMPSGNSLMAYNLIWLYEITGESAYRNQYETLSETVAAYLSQHPTGASHALSAHLCAAFSARHIVARTHENDSETEEKLRLIRESYHPNKLVLVNPNGTDVPFAKDMTAIDDKTTIYVCENFACKSPITSLSDVQSALVNAAI